MCVIYLVAICIVRACSGNWLNEVDEEKYKYIISCHSTDFTCMRRQYLSLRDNVFLSNALLGTKPFEPYVFSYDNSTCVKVSGIEGTQLVSISYNGSQQEISLKLDWPFRMEQINGDAANCSGTKPEGDKEQASVLATLPFRLLKKGGAQYLDLLQEDLDIYLEITDYTAHKNGTGEDRLLYESSEWAYEAAQNFDAATSIVEPYIMRIRNFTAAVPLHRYLMLYPEEKYSTMAFKYSDTDTSGCQCG